MLAIPAIDIMDGKVVRLYRGEKTSVKIYSDNPRKIAERWKEKGAKLIHVVDLDAAFGSGNNTDVIKEIIDVGVKVQLGGGIRDLRKVKEVVNLGVERIIIGTKATDPDFLEMVIKFTGGDKIGIGVDVLGGKFMKSGWQEETSYNLFDFVNYVVSKGIKWIIYTDINRDGTLTGINIEEVKKLFYLKGVNVIVSGGVGSKADFINIKKDIPFAYGVIIGKALYQKLVDLSEAIRLLK